MADGFLGRWSRRKLDGKEGKAVEAVPLREDLPPPQPSSSGVGAEGGQPSPQPAAASGRTSESAPQQASMEPPEHPLPSPSPSRGEGRGEGAAAQPAADPPPTLADVAGLTPESDFRRFIARDVAPDVKSAAMKKLFADPHFNVMDRLDTYIDDYSQPDPIPESMLRQLASAQFLGLFREEGRKDEDAAGGKQPTDELAPQSVAQSGASEDAVPAADVPGSPSVSEPAPDADADLRLQQDDAPEGREPGQGAG